eukprot:TRINITY_DN41340_c0_g1_i1.p1 TRINITY_DN41340_c0_g1~~TRINITY_DN41340_c0_g1_i1.p1  ORF type:complete len:543 (+),score=86.64 TRINITY_DN41340_c0_g1_i1:111-1631(+)
MGKKVKKRPILDAAAKAAQGKGNGKDKKQRKSSTDTGGAPLKIVTDSKAAARKRLEWLIAPTSIETFEEHVRDIKPLLVKRGNRNYYRNLFTRDSLSKALKKGGLVFGGSIDITRYQNQQRETLPLTGPCTMENTWGPFEEGCTIRVLHPQTFNTSVWHLNSTLEEHFGCVVGANVYLTPEGTQGFAPHFDDVDVFIVQTEGSKRWRLYPSVSDAWVLGRLSSGDFHHNELGEPFMDVVLEQGDLLWLPRGTIHEAKAQTDGHSTHLTISTNQKTSWYDFLKIVMDRSLRTALQRDLEFRRELPSDVAQYMGFMHASQTDEDLVAKRKAFFEKTVNMIISTLSSETVDDATDNREAQFMYDRLPPCLNKAESSVSVKPSPDVDPADNLPTFTEDTRLRLLRSDVLRFDLGREESPAQDDSIVVRTFAGNTRIYREAPQLELDFPDEDAFALYELVKAYPQWLSVKELAQKAFEVSGAAGQPDVEAVMSLTESLYANGILMTEPKGE